MDVRRGEWSPSVSTIFHLLIDGTLTEALRSCVFGEEFRRSLTDVSEITDVDTEGQKKLSRVLHEFERKVDFSLSVNLQHLISQLFGAGEPKGELSLVLTPAAAAVEMPDEEAITTELAAMLSSPIGTALIGEDSDLCSDQDQAGGVSSTCSLMFSLSTYQ